MPFALFYAAFAPSVILQYRFHRYSYFNGLWFSHNTAVIFSTTLPNICYGALGFFQYLAPTLMFIIAIFVFDETISFLQLVTFALVWSAIFIYLWDVKTR